MRQTSPLKETKFLLVGSLSAACRRVSPRAGISPGHSNFQDGLCVSPCVGVGSWPDSAFQSASGRSVLRELVSRFPPRVSGYLPGKVALCYRPPVDVVIDATIPLDSEAVKPLGRGVRLSKEDPCVLGCVHTQGSCRRGPQPQGTIPPSRWGLRRV